MRRWLHQLNTTQRCTASLQYNIVPHQRSTSIAPKQSTKPAQHSTAQHSIAHQQSSTMQSTLTLHLFLGIKFLGRRPGLSFCVGFISFFIAGARKLDMVTSSPFSRWLYRHSISTFPSLPQPFMAWCGSALPWGLRWGLQGPVAQRLQIYTTCITYLQPSLARSRPDWFLLHQRTAQVLGPQSAK